MRLVMYNRVEIKLDFRKKAEQSSTTTTGAKTFEKQPSATFFGSFRSLDRNLQFSRQLTATISTTTTKIQPLRYVAKMLSVIKRGVTMSNMLGIAKNSFVFQLASLISLPLVDMVRKLLTAHIASDTKLVTMDRKIVKEHFPWIKTMQI